MLPLSRSRSNSNEGVLHILQISKAGALHSDSLRLYLGHSLGVGVLSLCSGAVDLFYCPSQLGKKKYIKENYLAEDFWTNLDIFQKVSISNIFINIKSCLQKSPEWSIFSCVFGSLFNHPMIFVFEIRSPTLELRPLDLAMQSGAFFGAK